jgi:aspartate-semialdehyde dehydrogenase
MKKSEIRVGLVGWRGMVGSVLMDRMQAENDFDLIEPVFFSTSNAGGVAPPMAKNETKLLDGHDVDALKACDIILTCQGGDYTSEGVSQAAQLRAGAATGSMLPPPCA